MYGIRQEDLPEIMKMEVGDSRYLVMKVEMVAIGKLEDIEKKEK